MGRPLLVGIGVIVAVAILAFVFWGSSGDGDDIASSSSSASSVSAGVVHYGSYIPEAVGRGTSILLFFASDDPFSEASERFLKAAYGSGSAKLSTYRLEFRSSTGARLTYGVIVENTFVLLDGGGERVTAVVHPTQEELRILLRGNIPVAP